MLSKLSEKDWYSIVFTLCDKNDIKIPQINKVVLKMNCARPWDGFPRSSSAIYLLHESQGHADNFKEFEKTGLLVELVCKDIEGVLLKRVTRHLFLQLALHTVSKRKLQKWHFRCFGHIESDFFLIAVVFKVQLRHRVQTPQQWCLA